MKYLKKIEEYQGEHRTVITLGKFDGLHRGHQKLIHTVIEIATESKKQGDRIDSVVFAFDMLAMRKQKCGVQGQIMMNEERRAFLEGQVDCLLECPFDEHVRCMQAEEFIQNILVAQFKAQYIVVGEDFRFGYKAQGDIALLRTYASRYGYEVIGIEKERYGEREISSTYVKEQLLKGEIQVANEMLGYEYSITGEVIHGQKLGRTLGFPTLNIPVVADKLLPPYGVYAVKVSMEKGVYHGVANLGTKPTVLSGGQPLVETHVYDYDGDAYGETATVSFLQWMRPEQKFANIDALKNQVDADLREARNWIAEKTLQY